MSQLQIVAGDGQCPNGCEDGWITSAEGARPCPLHYQPPRVATGEDPLTGAEAMLSPLFSWRGAICSKFSGLPPALRLTALVLSLHMNEKGGSAFPSLQTLADEAGISRRQMIRNLQDLVDRKWLKAEKRKLEPTVYSTRFPGGFRSQG